MRPVSPELAGGLRRRRRLARAATSCSPGWLAPTASTSPAARSTLPGRDVHRQPQPGAQYNGIKLCRAGARPVGQDTGPGPDPGPRPGAARRARRPRRLRPAPAAGEVTGSEDLLGRLRRATCAASSTCPASGRCGSSSTRATAWRGLTTPAVLGTAAGLPELPLDVVPLYFELDGTFPNHEANPLEPANLRDLQAAVVARGRRPRAGLRRRRRPLLRRRRARRARLAVGASPRWSPAASSPRSARPAASRP